MKAMGKDARNLIRHWQDEGSELRCTWASEGVGVSVDGPGDRAVRLGAVDHGDGVRGAHPIGRGVLRLSRVPRHPVGH